MARLENVCLAMINNQLDRAWRMFVLDFSHLAGALIRVTYSFILRWLDGKTTYHSHRKYIFPLT
jgi:hypothetical protein